MTITILTTTYNRGKEVKVLWESIRKQTKKDFEWLIIDDGSTDDTKSIIDQLQSESDFPIRYIYKTNGGKHTALNAGIKEIDSELTFIVDSDDCITNDCISSIIEVHKKYKNNQNICGYAFLRSFPDGRINGKKFKKNEIIASYIDIRINSDDTKADKAEVFKTRCLKEYSFPEYPDEYFLGEDIVWIRMARRYEMVHINKVIYIGNYLSNGLTINRRKHNITSPIGCMRRAEEFMKSDIKFKYRIKGGLQYIIYGKFAGFNTLKLIHNVQNKWIVMICILPGLILHQRWKNLSKARCKN